MNKRDLGHQWEDRILVAEEEILHEIENQPRKSSRRLANQFLSLRVQNAAQENRRIILQTMAGILSNFFHVSFYAFTRNYSLFTLLFSE
jgi:hypothetical protein